MSDDPTPGQRSFMLKLYHEHDGDEAAVTAEYAKAEQAGQVARKSNEHDLDAVAYARALWRDGIKKGWLP